MFHRHHGSRLAGDAFIGFLLHDDKQEIERESGQQARFHVLFKLKASKKCTCADQKEESMRRLRFFNNYRPQFPYFSELTTKHYWCETPT